MSGARVERNCIICGKKFETYPYFNTACCGYECREKRRLSKN